MRCYGCMEKLSGSRPVCPKCGYDNQRDPARQLGQALPCGSKLHGKYMIGQALGKGGFAITYLAWDEEAENRVAIKEFFPEGLALRNGRQSSSVYWSGSDADVSIGRRSFLKEAHNTSLLRDLPSIVNVLEVFDENNTSYLVMDYIDGTTLEKHLLRTGQTWTEQECVRIFAPVIKDLAEAHRRKIIHRDISPDNLMRSPDGHLTLLDLGAAKDLSHVTKHSDLLVTKKGFSPMEQYAQLTRAGPWTDVYAICATIYDCVTGKAPPAPLERYSGQPLDLSALTPGFAAVLERGLAIEPGSRIQSCDQLLEELEALYPAQEEKKEASRPSHLREIIAAAAAVALLAIGAAILFSSGIGGIKDAVIPEPTATELAAATPAAQSPQPTAEEKAVKPTPTGKAIQPTPAEKAVKPTPTRTPAQTTRPTATPKPTPTPRQTATPTPTPRRTATPAPTLDPITSLKAAAGAGDVNAMYRLGLMYYEGNGTARDYLAAYDWFDMAAKAGNGWAYYYVGLMYYYGYGVEVNTSYSQVCWQRAKAILGDKMPAVP